MILLLLLLLLPYLILIPVILFVSNHLVSLSITPIHLFRSPPASCSPFAEQRSTSFHSPVPAGMQARVGSMVGGVGVNYGYTMWGEGKGAGCRWRGCAFVEDGREGGLEMSKRARVFFVFLSFILACVRPSRNHTCTVPGPSFTQQAVTHSIYE